MAVDFPVGACEGPAVGFAPALNGAVRSAQAAVKTKMRCGGDCATGGCRMYDLALFGERAWKLHADFEPDGAIPIDGDVAAALCLLRSQSFPD
jgi:hypothetical protein